MTTGCHVYFPGFTLGLERAGFTDGGSYETYPLGIKGRRVIGRPVHRLSKTADLVHSNPPCSRYSMQSVSAFSRDEQEQLETFT